MKTQGLEYVKKQNDDQRCRAYPSSQRVLSITRMRTQSPVPEDVGENTVWELSLGNDVRTRWVICEPRSPKWQRPLASLDPFRVGVIDKSILISFSAYAIIAIGKMIKLNSLVTQQKASEVASPRLFYSVLARVAYSPGWLPATIFYPAICKCNR